MAFQDGRHGQHIFAGHLIARQGIADEDAADEGCRTASQAAGQRNSIDQRSVPPLGRDWRFLMATAFMAWPTMFSSKLRGQGIGSQTFDFDSDRVFIRFFRKINVIVQVQRKYRRHRNRSRR